MPGRLRSSVYLPAPVALPPGSSLGEGWPSIGKLVICHSERSEESAFCLQAQHHFTAAIPSRSAAIADLIASYIWLYPVQRHRLLLNASRTSASVGSGFSASSDFTVMTKPGVQ